MQPFLKNKQEASVSSTPDKIKRKSDEEAEFDLVEIAAEDLGRALEKKDYKAAASALRAAFEMFDSQPHEEGPHV